LDRSGRAYTPHIPTSRVPFATISSSVVNGYHSIVGAVEGSAAISAETLSTWTCVNIAE
jgi:hypothetical protein